VPASPTVNEASCSSKGAFISLTAVSEIGVMHSPLTTIPFLTMPDLIMLSSIFIPVSIPAQALVMSKFIAE